MLLDLKTVGWGPATNPTARRIELFADWIEAQAFLSLADGALTKPNIIDRLEGTSLVRDNDDGWALVDDAFSVCRSRRSAIGLGYPFSIAGDVIEVSDSLATPYLFCLLTSLPEQLKYLRTSYPAEFRYIFEDLVAEAMAACLPGWRIHSTGWSALGENQTKGAIVSKVGMWTLAKKWDESVFAHANDAQVDIAAVRPFNDSRSAFPVILGQCATGVTDWKKKASRPNLDRWAHAVAFTSKPTKLFAVPFALDDESFWEATVECSGLVLDRSRLCTHLPKGSDGLTARIQAWLDAAILLLPIAA